MYIHCCIFFFVFFFMWEKHLINIFIKFSYHCCSVVINLCPQNETFIQFYGVFSQRSFGSVSRHSV